MARKKAWGPSNPLWRWQHRKGKGKKARKSHASSKPKRRRSVAKKHRSRSKKTIPVLTLLAVAAPVVWAGTVNGWDPQRTVTSYVSAMTGYDTNMGNWRAERLVTGWGPIAAVTGIKLAARYAGIKLPTVGPLALR